MPLFCKNWIKGQLESDYDKNNYNYVDPYFGYFGSTCLPPFLFFWQHMYDGVGWR